MLYITIKNSTKPEPVISSNIITSLWNWSYRHHHHYIDEEIKEQRNYVSHLKPRIWETKRLRRKTPLFTKRCSVPAGRKRAGDAIKQEPGNPCHMTWGWSTLSWPLVSSSFASEPKFTHGSGQHHFLSWVVPNHCIAGEYRAHPPFLCAFLGSLVIIRVHQSVRSV